MSFPQVQSISYHDFSKSIHTLAVNNRIPINGALELTMRCNLRCVHCYCCHDQTKNEMSFDQIRTILDEVSNQGCLWLLITGGEPLLRPDFVEIYKYAKRKGLIISLFTNGTLLTEEIGDCLKDLPPFSVEISLYGATKKTYELVTGVDGSFERCIQGINLLVERKVPLKLKTMALTLNKHELWQMKKYANNLRIEFKFDPIVNPRIDGFRGPTGFRIAPEEIAKLDVEHEDRFKEWKQFCQKYWHSEYSDDLFTCAAGKDSFHIDPYGNLMPCVLARKFSYNLLEGTFTQGWRDFLAQVRLQKYAGENKCRGCEVIPACERCVAWSCLENGDPESPVDYLCQIAYARAQALGMIENNKTMEVAE